MKQLIGVYQQEVKIKQPGLTYSASGPFTKNKKIIQKFEETGDSDYIYPNELVKACFQHDMADGDVKDLTRTIASDIMWHDEAFNFSKYPKYDEYQSGVAPMDYKYFEEKGSGGTVKNKNISNKRPSDLVPQ